MMVVVECIVLLSPVSSVGVAVVSSEVVGPTVVVSSTVPVLFTASVVSVFNVDLSSVADVSGISVSIVVSKTVAVINVCNVDISVPVVCRLLLAAPVDWTSVVSETSGTADDDVALPLVDSSSSVLVNSTVDVCMEILEPGVGVADGTLEDVWPA
ncbi:hypothetical protein GDO81_019957 [Engystomops pustulosus]|uniref:Secreted protein n=1 Tax=Engystomops pustulosus TaxID=76066 RepID=A0AAV6ZF50_ENGPU|nr:hypothetical protein GDO81_019957 [Engystomops pustulosus]